MEGGNGQGQGGDGGSEATVRFVSYFSSSLFVITRLYSDTLCACRYFPRYHLHFTCDENGDHSCFSGGGVCVMNKLTKTLKHDQHEHGPDLNQWVNKPVEFTGSCSCQIINDDIFSDLV